MFASTRFAIRKSVFMFFGRKKMKLKPLAFEGKAPQSHTHAYKFTQQSRHIKAKAISLTESQTHTKNEETKMCVIFARQKEIKPLGDKQN